MKNNQPFITTLREEWREENARMAYTSPEEVELVADFWLQKMSDQKERLIKEVEGMKKMGDDFPKETKYRFLIAKGYNKAQEDILRRLQSV